jgi:hypothetical protein
MEPGILAENEASAEANVRRTFTADGGLLWVKAPEAVMRVSND